MNEKLQRVRDEVKRRFDLAKKDKAFIKAGDVKLSYFYEQVAQEAGYKNWNVYSAILKKRD